MGSNKISPINTWPHVSALFTKAVLIGFGVRDTWRVWSGLRKIRLRGTDAVRLLTNKCPFSRGIGRETRVFGEMLVDVVFRGGCVWSGGSMEIYGRVRSYGARGKKNVLNI